MTKRYYHYHIKIVFEKKRMECKQGVLYSDYLNGKGGQDTFVFLPKELNIVAHRTKMIEDGKILSSNKNSVYYQILKALLYYYALSHTFPKIKNVEIILKRAKSEDVNYKECTNFIQPLISGINNPFVFDPNKLKALFCEDERGEALRAIISNWLKAVSSNDRYYCFEHLWKAFNRIYVFYGRQLLSKINEKECQIKIREFILNNQGLISNSIAITNSYTEDAIRFFRWRAFVLNEYNVENKTNELIGWIKNYHDKRIMALFTQILPYRQKFISNIGRLNEVKKHINENNSTTIDAELVVLIAIKYAYFARNKMMHGELPDSTFKIHENREDVEYDKLNTLLSTLVAELINNLDSLQLP
jgi:hypothetical protein